MQSYNTVVCNIPGLPVCYNASTYKYPLHNITVRHA